MARSKARSLVEQVTGERYDGSMPEGFTRRHYGPMLGKAGDSITGIYLGKGKPRKGRKGKMIGTYRIQTDGGGVVEILAAVQIEQFLEDVKPKQRIWIKRLEQVKGGKGRVNVYDFAVEE